MSIDMRDSLVHAILTGILFALMFGLYSVIVKKKNKKNDTDNKDS
jgi:hypothetical protein